MSTNYSIKTDLNEAQAMADGLADYVRGSELYGNAGGGFFSKIPSLTVGALLMRLRRLETLQSEMNSKQKGQFESIYERWQTTRNDWRMHYEEKMAQEIDSRLDSMTTFFKECADSQQNCHNNYRPEIQKRTIIEELLLEMERLNMDDQDLRDRVQAADSKLRTYLRSDDFQWDDTLQKIYPKSDYWWLYQKPPQGLHEN